MKFCRLVVLLAMILPTLCLTGQNRKELYTPNMQRALEAYSNTDIEESEKYFLLELENNNKNGYAYNWLALLNIHTQQYGKAISYATKAIEYIPKKDKEYVAFAYSTRSKVYLYMGDMDKAMKDINLAIKLYPQIGVYKDRGDLYFALQKYDLSDKDYQKCIELESTDPYGYMGIGRNAAEQKKYNKAIQMYDKVIQLHGFNYMGAYSFRAESYIALGRFDEAASDIVNVLATSSDDKTSYNKAYYNMFRLADSSYLTIMSRLKIQKTKEPNNEFWIYCLGIVSEHSRKYDKAIEYYKEAIDNGMINSAFFERLSSCYVDMGNYNIALDYINRAIDLDSSDLDYWHTRATINYELDNQEKTLNDLDYCIKQQPDNYWCYYKRGWYKSLFGDKEGALEDYTSSITLNPNYSYVYVSRGKLFLDMGEKKLAKKDFEKCIELDTVDMNDMTCAFYAYQHLGDNENALRLLDTLLSKGGSIYEAVCLHSLIGNKAKAIEYMKKAFEEGYRSFTHIKMDSDLDNIRDEVEFKQLVAEYKAKWEKETKTEAKKQPHYIDKTVEIPFIRKGGVTEIKCKINDLPLYFIFDTGAGDVTISSVEAAFMLKNGYLTDKDFVGKKSYVTASGDIVDGTVINLAKIEIGGLALHNVTAAVVKGQKAPLLLGQSVLSKLGKIEIDNEKQAIKITYKEEVK